MLALSTLFYAGALLLGIPAFGATLFFGFMALSIGRVQRPDPATTSGIDQSLIKVVVAMGQVIGTAGWLVGKLGRVLAVVLTLAGLLLLALASWWLMIAHGLAAGEEWTHVAAAVTLGGTLLFFATLAITDLSRRVRASFAILAIACGYGLWLLWTSLPPGGF